MFCFQSIGGNAEIEQLTPGKRQRVFLNGSDKDPAPVSDLDEGSYRYAFPKVLLLSTIFLGVFLWISNSSFDRSCGTDAAKNPAKREWNPQFRLLYVLGMILIVANHKPTGVSLLYELFPAYAFHVGLFVFVSGYFYRPDCEKNLWEYLCRKTSRLLVPLYFWNWIYAILSGILARCGFFWGETVTLETLFLAPIYRGGQFGLDRAIWFVAPLWLTEVCVPILRRMMGALRLRNRQKEILIFIAALALGILGIYEAEAGLNRGWGLVVIRLLYFIPFYCAGYFYRSILESHDRLPNAVYFGIVLLLDLIVIMAHQGTQIVLPADGIYYGFSVLPFIFGFLGIAFWLRIARILAPLMAESRVCNAIADHTYAIMANHFLGFFLLNLLYNVLCHFQCSLFASFDNEAFHLKPVYAFSINGISQTLILYTAAGIACGVGIGKLERRLRNAVRMSCWQKIAAALVLIIAAYLLCYL